MIPLTGSAFIRSLAALSGAQVAASEDDFGRRMTQWFGWTHTFALSAALGEASAPTASPDARPPAGADAQERDRVRAALVSLLSRAPSESPDAATDFASHRRHYTACQQAMDAQIAPLRRKLRAALAGGTPAQAQLARLDGVMDEVVGAQERALLATVPGLLQARFDQGHRDAQAVAVSEPASDAGQPAAWLASFRQDLRALLLAELDFRLQPVDGLLAASRSPSPDRHDD